MSRIENALEKASRIRETEGMPARLQPLDDGIAAPEAPLSGHLNPCLVTLLAPDSPAAEEYRKLKAMVMKSTQGSPRTTIMVTSCTSGEGKSLLSINLAVSLAQEVGCRALLIDADLRRPSIAQYLGIDAGAGLAECLRDGDSLSSVITRTGVPRLDLIPAGKSVRNPVELLSSPKMKSLLGELRRSSQDRFIIIDTPPVLPFAETQNISLLVDGVVFVVKEGAVTAQELHNAIELLHGSTMLGVAFNEVSVQSMNQRYRNYYRYYEERKHQPA